MKKHCFLIIILLCFSLVLLRLSIRVNAQELIYIRPDGVVEGGDKIQKDGNVYTLTDNITRTITIERNCTILDGAGYTLQGNGMNVSGSAIQLFAQNCTIMNLQIKDYTIGMEAPYSYNSFLGNVIEDCYTGIHILGGSSNVIQYNTFQNNFHSISLVYCSGNNTITKNNFITSQSDDAMWVWYGAEPTIDGNYWNKYSGDDTDGDGIGDVPHVFREVNQDDYQDNNPLMVAVDINVIPEFPSCVVLPLIFVASFIAIFYKKKIM